MKIGEEQNGKSLNIALYIFYFLIVVFVVGFILYTMRDNQYFSLKTNDVDMIVDSEYKLLLIGRNGDVDYSNYTFESNNNDIATVSNDGIVHAVSEGETKIVVKSKKYSFEDTLDVNIEGKNIYSISFENDSIVLKVNEKYTPKVLVNNSSKMNVDIKWSSSNKKVVSVVDGTITALKIGTAYVTATNPETKLSSRIKVSVVKKDATKDKIEEKGDTPKKEDDSKKHDSIEIPDEVINDYVGVSSVRITSSINELNIGEEKDIKYEIIPTTASNKTVTWSSNNPSVVSVDNKGHIKALKPGSANISIVTDDGNKSTFITINVKETKIDVTSISLNSSKLSLVEGGTSQLKVTFNPSNATNKNVIYKSNNDEVASVSDDGVVTANSIGNTKIIVASSNGKTATCEVVVSKKIIYVNSIKLSESKVTINRGETKLLSYTLSPSDANELITWSSSNFEVVSVNSAGRIAALKSGSATIKVKTSKGKSASCEIVVKEPNIEVNSIKLSKTSTSIIEGGSEILKITFDPENATNKKVTWSTSNSNIATVDSSGKVSAIKEGTAQITVKTSNGKTASCEVKVSKKVINVENISLNKTSITLEEGKVDSLVASVTPSNATNQNVSFSSSNTSVVKIDTNGKVTAVSPGTATITAKSSNNKTVSCIVRVTKKEIFADKITVSPNKVTLEVGKTRPLSAEILPSDATNKTITWSSSNNKIASINSEGRITAKKAGSATITATTSNGKTSTCLISVTVPVTKITLNKKELSINKGGSSTLKASIEPSNASNKNITWSTSNSKVAKVDKNGKVTSVAGGTATITAKSSNGKTATCSVTVVSKITSLKLNKSDFILNYGSSTTLSVSITPSDATNKTLSWYSKDTNIVSVDQNGKVTAKGIGRTQVYASSTDGSSKKVGVNITVAPKGNIINIKNNKISSSDVQSGNTCYDTIAYKTNKPNIEARFKDVYNNNKEVRGKHIQNFAISNLNKSNEKVFLSTASAGCFDGDVTEDTTKSNNLRRTIVFRYSKQSDGKYHLDTTTPEVMFLDFAGHGQQFDIDPNSNNLWVNANGYAEYDPLNNYSWGYSHGIMRIEFKNGYRIKKYTDYNSVAKPLINQIQVGDSNYNNMQPSVNKAKDNGTGNKNLLLLNGGRTVLVFDYDEFVKGNQVLLHRITLQSVLNSNYKDGTYISNQGFASKDGYIYVLKGSSEYDSYIEVFDFMGTSQYVVKLGGNFLYRAKSSNNSIVFDTSTKRLRIEAEGIKIYDNRIYVGSTHIIKKDNENRTVIDIGYY